MSLTHHVLTLRSVSFSQEKLPEPLTSAGEDSPIKKSLPPSAKMGLAVRTLHPDTEGRKAGGGEMEVNCPTWAKVAFLVQKHSSITGIFNGAPSGNKDLLGASSPSLPPFPWLTLLHPSVLTLVFSSFEKSSGFSLNLADCLIAQSCLTLCNPMGCSIPGFPVLNYLPEFAQTHVHWVSDSIQPSLSLPPPSPPDLIV